MKHATLLIIALLLAPLATAESLLVTITYNRGTLTLTHAELIRGDASIDSEGGFTLAYDTPTGTKPVTRLDVPIIESTDQGMHVLDTLQHAIAIPWQPGATSISLYAEGKKVATLPITTIKRVGDATGTPPPTSIAARAGKTSITNTLAGIAKGEITPDQLALPPTTSGVQPSRSWLLGALGILAILFFGVTGLVVVVVIVWLVLKSGKKKNGGK